MKKFKKSPIAVISYVIAAALAVYFCVVAVQTVNTINDYYASYGMTAAPGETISYIMQQGLNYLIYAVVIFLEGFILDSVRKLDPANWATEDEIAEAKKVVATEAAEDEEEAGEVEVDAEAEEDKETVFTAEVDGEVIELGGEEAEEVVEEVAEDTAEVAEALKATFESQTAEE